MLGQNSSETLMLGVMGVIMNPLMGGSMNSQETREQKKQGEYAAQNGFSATTPIVRCYLQSNCN
jgi:hypothetical protein